MAKNNEKKETFDQAVSCCRNEGVGYVFLGTCKLSDVLENLAKYGWKPAEMKGNQKTRVKNGFKEVAKMGMKCETFYNSKANRQIAFIGTIPNAIPNENGEQRIFFRILSKK